eukprot:jgi/Chrzof1/9456/Cz04g03230.t1
MSMTTHSPMMSDDTAACQSLDSPQKVAVVHSYSLDEKRETEQTSDSLCRSLSDPSSVADSSLASSSSLQQPWRPDYTFKVLLVGDSGVGKTCLLLRFISNKFEEKMNSTVGVDFAVKRMTLHDCNVKVTLWDTAGQERFRTLTTTFYRGAKGIIFVYDVTRRETLQSLENSWMDELEQYSPHPDVAKMVVANKVDQVGRWALTDALLAAASLHRTTAVTADVTAVY